jgi:hypothetical protein
MLALSYTVLSYNSPVLPECLTAELLSKTSYLNIIIERFPITVALINFSFLSLGSLLTVRT